MRYWLLTALVGGSLLGTVPSTGTEPRRQIVQQFLIDLKVRQGDPLGDREAEEINLGRPRREPGPARILAESKLHALEGREASFRCHDSEEPKVERVDGASLKLGYQLRVVPARAARGDLRLKITMEHTEV